MIIVRKLIDFREEQWAPYYSLADFLYSRSPVLQHSASSSSDSAPPEADGEADIQGPDVVPALGWDVQHLARVQSALTVLCTLEEGESGQVWCLHINL